LEVTRCTNLLEPVPLIAAVVREPQFHPLEAVHDIPKIELQQGRPDLIERLPHSEEKRRYLVKLVHNAEGRPVNPLTSNLDVLGKLSRVISLEHHPTEDLHLASPQLL
jgi:hypothetical protein